MRRRTLLKAAAAGALAVAGSRLLPAPLLAAGPSPLEGLTVIDIHAHPDSLMSDGTARISDLRGARLSAACFAAVGDLVWSGARKTARSEHDSVLRELHGWLEGPVARGEVALVRKAADIPGPAPAKPGAILAIEGGDPLEGRVERVDEFYALGVRIVTLIHDRNNELGDTMRPNKKGRDSGPSRGGLSEAGRAVVARMEELGMLVDVAHASAATLRDVLAVAKKPVVDSHTGPCRRDLAADAQGCGRTRTWEEMEWVAKAGGVVGSWVSGPASGSRGFADWARDILEMQKRLGLAAVGLGTDSGGHLPSYVDGYTGWTGLDKLGRALVAEGAGREELAAFFGGNALRVLRQCLA
jgi:microsomal dipeptidase-like Zn-dependent dipeptidase